MVLFSSMITTVVLRKGGGGFDIIKGVGSRASLVRKDESGKVV